MIRFSHLLLGTVTNEASGTKLRSACDTRPLAISIAKLNEVAKRLEPWANSQFELRVHVDLGTFTPPSGPVVPLDKTTAFVEGVARRVQQESHSFRRHGFAWHVCEGVLALRDGEFLRVIAPTAPALRPWLEESAALRLQCFFPLLRAAGESPVTPESSWVEFRDYYVDETARAILGDEAVRLDLPLGDGGRFHQSVVGFLCASVDPATRTLALSPRARDAAARWLCRRHEADDPARLGSWVFDNGSGRALADTAAEAERSFGGLRSVDRIQRFGGIQMLERALAPGSVADSPLQETPDGPAVLMSQRDVDNPDTLACITANGSMWAYQFSWDYWERSSDSVSTFVSRVALWGHPDEVPIHLARASLGRELARELGLHEVAEASDSTGTFYAGDTALVFERTLSEGRVTRMRELRPEAVLAWDALTSRT
jgi:hypothetical protein